MASVCGGKYVNLPGAYNSRDFPRETNSSVGPPNSESLIRSNRRATTSLQDLVSRNRSFTLVLLT